MGAWKYERIKLEKKESASKIIGVKLEGFWGREQNYEHFLKNEKSRHSSRVSWCAKRSSLWERIVFFRKIEWLGDINAEMEIYSNSSLIFKHIQSRGSCLGMRASVCRSGLHKPKSQQMSREERNWTCLPPLPYPYLLSNTYKHFLFLPQIYSQRFNTLTLFRTQTLNVPYH